MAKQFLTEEERTQIITAIKKAEKETSGEIRVHIEGSCSKPVLDRASEVFALLKMHQTAERNGVLFYLAHADKKFALIGDAGINRVVPDNFWESTKEGMKNLFRQNRFSDGICFGIEQAGHLLKTHFPYQANDRNELSDEISFGKD